MIYPIVVAAVAFCFAAILFRQYLQRRRPYQLVWTAALTMGWLAAAAFALFLVTDRNEALFRIYYIFGALLMAAYLGLGSIYLLAPRRAADITATIIVLLSIAGAVFVLLAPLNTTALHASNVEAGTKIITGPAVVFIAVLNAFGAFAVIGGAVWSAWRLWRRHGPARLLMSNVLIATGTILAALAGTLARVTGNGSAFWLLLALGFVVLFAGFLLTTLGGRPAPVATAAKGSVPASG